MKLYQCTRCKKVFVVNHNQVDLLARCPDCENKDSFPDCDLIVEIRYQFKVKGEIKKIWKELRLGKKMIIPKQLQNKDFRFVKIQVMDKKPFEPNWQNSNNYSYDDINLISWLNNNNNYGIVCGKGDLAIIDCDEQEITIDNC